MTISNDELTPERPSTRLEKAVYIHEMTRELKRIAMEGRFPFLGYLIEMSELQARIERDALKAASASPDMFAAS